MFLYTSEATGVTVSIRHKLMGDMIHAHFQKLNVIYLGNIN